MQSKSSSPRRFLALFAMSSAMMLGTFLVPAYGQEMDPTWYDPWATSAPAAQNAQAKAAKNHQGKEAKVKSASTSETAKVRVKKSTKQRPS